jgi:hypothetical protein
MRTLRALALCGLMALGFVSGANATGVASLRTKASVSDLRSAPAYFDTLISTSTTADTISFGFIADAFDVLNASSTATDTAFVTCIGTSATLPNGLRAGRSRVASTVTVAGGSFGYPVLPQAVMSATITANWQPTLFQGYRAFKGCAIKSKGSAKKVYIRAWAAVPYKAQ